MNCSPLTKEGLNFCPQGCFFEEDFQLRCRFAFLFRKKGKLRSDRLTDHWIVPAAVRPIEGPAAHLSDCLSDCLSARLTLRLRSLLPSTHRSKRPLSRRFQSLLFGHLPNRLGYRV